MSEFLSGVIIIAAAYSTFMIGYSLAEADLQTKAIEIGCAQYNPQTAEFEWLNKNVSEKQKQ